METHGYGKQVESQTELARPAVKLTEAQCLEDCAFDARRASLQRLEDEDAAHLRTLTIAGGLRILESLLDAGFDMIESQIAEARRNGKDADRLARFLLRDEPM